jgi:biopolymer transport protein ExbD
MPEVNMIPMMGVMLVVLAFFVFVSMTLTSQQGFDVELPTAAVGGKEMEAPNPFIVGMNQQGQILLEGQTITPAQLEDKVVTYFEKNPQGTVLLKANRELGYDKVIAVLQTIRDIGGDRVSLAVES